jgi:hypothetical protein
MFVHISLKFLLLFANLYKKCLHSLDLPPPYIFLGPLRNARFYWFARGDLNKSSVLNQTQDTRRNIQYVASYLLARSPH